MITLGITILVLLALGLGVAMIYRTIVPTNEVHIVQSGSNTTPYGKDLLGGAVYYNRPSSLPIVGITRIVLPTSIFTIELRSYSAYDKEKVPFTVDIMAWFRIEDSKTAAQRIYDFNELKNQLDDILKGSVRAVLASDTVSSIMEARKELGEKFKEAVLEQATQYGVHTSNIEFMDIRDPQDGGSSVIANIMEKKKSAIEKESRVEVANNKKIAEIAEIQAKQEAEVKRQAAQEVVGKREAEKNEIIGIASEKTKQSIQEQAKITTEKNMEVLKVEEIKKAEIEKEKEIVKASEEKQTTEIRAEAKAKRSELVADGEMKAEKAKAEGIRAVGEATAEAEKAMQLASVKAQIELVKEIGENKDYMEYLLSIDGIKAGEVVGVAKAKALESGDLKIIANGQGDGTVSGGLNNIMDIFSGKGGSELSTMLETLGSTPFGETLLKNILSKTSEEQEVIQAE